MSNQSGRLDALRLIPVSSEVEERFDVFIALLGRWRKTTNLISEATFGSVWTRHVADSAQILCAAPAALRWLDIGAGAGFPGLVLAMQLADVPGAVVHCIESDHRKCAFLREVARATSAPAIIHPVRVQSINPFLIGSMDGVTARAFAPLRTTVELARQWLAAGATGVFPRGRSAQKQLDSLPDSPNYIVDVIPSIVDTGAAFLRVRIS